jgi:hypothetical protein
MKQKYAADDEPTILVDRTVEIYKERAIEETA